MEIRYLYNNKGNQMANCILVTDEFGFTSFFSYETLMFVYDHTDREIMLTSNYRSNTTSRQINTALKWLGLNIKAKDLYKLDKDKWVPV